MRKNIHVLTSMLFSVVAPAFAGDKITYLACRADNEYDASNFGLDDAAHKVCDRSVETTWFSPTTFESAKVIWTDGFSTKAVYRTGQDKRYEHDFLLLVHVGHCEKVEPAASQFCKPP
jgi:hypothetical protein